MQFYDSLPSPYVVDARTELEGSQEGGSGIGGIMTTWGVPWEHLQNLLEMPAGTIADRIPRPGHRGVGWLLVLLGVVILVLGVDLIFSAVGISGPMAFGITYPHRLVGAVLVLTSFVVLSTGALFLSRGRRQTILL